MSDLKDKPEGYVFGRPTDYRKEYIQQMLDYFSIDPYTETRKGRVSNKFPSFERFATSIGVTHKTLLRWKERYSDFSQAYALCKDLQWANVNEGAMAGTYNSNYSKFLAINVTDMRERTQQDLNVKSEGIEDYLRSLKGKDEQKGSDPVQ